MTSPLYDIFTESESLTESDDPRLSGFLIDDSGKVTLPDGGRIFLKGSTIEESETKIQKYISNYLVNPTVVVKHLNFQFTILGEVNTPGTYTSYNRKTNMFEALGMAGDLTDFAERSRIKLVRYKAGRG